jgi:hypothetical protein
MADSTIKPTAGARATRPCHYSMQFRGHATWLTPGVLVAHATAPSSVPVTRIGTDECLPDWAESEAHLETRMTFLDDSRFEEAGTISFGNGHALRFRSLQTGTLEPSPDAHLWHGADTWLIDGGAGVFAGAAGKIVSNFLVSDTGDLTDNHLGLVFLPAPEDATGITVLPRELVARTGR